MKTMDDVNLQISVLNSLPDAVMISDTTGVIIYSNSSAQNLFGYEGCELEGEPLTMLMSGNMQHAHRSHEDNFFKSNLQTGRKLDTGKTFSARHKNGESIEVSISLSRIQSDGNTFALTIIRDVRAMVSLKKQFYQAQKMEAIGVLASGTAHDFNNHLAAINGNVYLLEKNLEKGNHEVVGTKILAIKESVETAGAIAKRLLSLSRHEHTLTEPIEIVGLMSQGFEVAKGVLPKNINHYCELCSNSITILGNKTELQQVLLNLLINARDAVAKTKHNPTILCSVSEYIPDELFVKKYPILNNKKVARISVKDNGHGIAPDKVDRVFEPFFTTKKDGEGSGLGLAMVYGAIQSHQGAIEVSSKLGSGTTFNLFFPIH